MSAWPAKSTFRKGSGSMPDVTLRKTATFAETIHNGNGPDTPPRHAAAIAANPFAGTCQAGPQGPMDGLRPLGLDMTDMLTEATGGLSADDVADDVKGEDGLRRPAEIRRPGSGIPNLWPWIRLWPNV